MKEDRFIWRVLFVSALIISLILLYSIRSVMTPVFSALLVAYVLYPIIREASKIGINKGLSILLIFLLIAVGTVFLASSLIPEIQREVILFHSPDQAKTAAESKLLKISSDIFQLLFTWGVVKKEKPPKEIIQLISTYIVSQGTIILKSIGSMVKETLTFLLVFLIVLIFALLDGDKFYKSFLNIVPNMFFESAVFILNKTTELMGNYLRGLVIENTILAIVSFLFLLIVCKLSSLSVMVALLIALIIAITNVIRIVGPILGGLIGILILLSTSGLDYWAILGVLAVVTIVQFCDNVLVLPLVMKNQVNVHPIISVVSVIAGGMIAGILGMILAIPIVAGIAVIYQVFTVEMKQFSA